MTVSQSKEVTFQVLLPRDSVNNSESIYSMKVSGGGSLRPYSFYHTFNNSLREFFLKKNAPLERALTVTFLKRNYSKGIQLNVKSKKKFKITQAMKNPILHFDLSKLTDSLHCSAKLRIPAHLTFAGQKLPKKGSSISFDFYPNPPKARPAISKVRKFSMPDRSSKDGRYCKAKLSISVAGKGWRQLNLYISYPSGSKRDQDLCYRASFPNPSQALQDTFTLPLNRELKIRGDRIIDLGNRYVSLYSKGLKIEKYMEDPEVSVCIVGENSQILNAALSYKKLFERGSEILSGKETLL